MHPSHHTLLNPSAVAWKWCVRCQRCYTRAAADAPALLSSCVYPDCDGAAIVCEYPWERIRRHDRSFPSTPRFGVRYAVYV